MTLPTACGPGAADTLLDEAIRVLSAAARRRDGPDFAEFVCEAIAGAAANVGGIDDVLGRGPRTWASLYLQNLLIAVVGDDESMLLQHRTEPLRITVHVRQILRDLGFLRLYDDAHAELDAHEAQLAAVTAPPAGAASGCASRAHLACLRRRLEQLRQADLVSYGQAFRATMLTVAGDVHPALPVPVEIDLDYESEPVDEAELALDCVVWERALRETPLPGSQLPLVSYPRGADLPAIERAAGRAPLQRLARECGRCERAERRS
jgi:hypothetical protein